MLRVSESCKNAIVCENGGQVRSGRMRRGKAAKTRPSNAEIVQNHDKMRPLNTESERKQQKCDRMRERGAGAGWEKAEMKSCQNATVKCRDCAKSGKMRPWNTEMSISCKNVTVRQNRGQGQHGRMRRGKAAKLRPSNAEIEQNQPK